MKKTDLDLLDEQKTSKITAWELNDAKFFTIVDGEWKGDEFAQLAHIRGAKVLKYNLSHPIHKEIISLCLSMEKETETEKLKANAKKLKVMIDLVILSYVRAEKGK